MSMQKAYNRIVLFFDALWGNILILPYAIFGVFGIKKLELSENRPHLVVSLTSYGRRVKKTVYYTIISLLKQSRRPNRIILWLDDSWNTENLPSRLRALTKLGVEINFCPDIRSYKKLIPTLQIACDDIIITVDDDVYYSSNLLSILYNSYLKQPESVQCTRALHVGVYHDGTLAPYKTWNKATDADDLADTPVFPIGEGGILYPPGSLFKDVTRKDLFQALCPNADDIWFWCMAKLNNRSHNVVTSKKLYYSFDALYQYFHKGAALTHSNRIENKNDVQFDNVIKHYPNIIHYFK